MKKKTEVFFRLRHLGKMNKEDYWEAYQIEVAKHEDGKWKKVLYDKPDVKQLTMGKLENLLLENNVEELV